MPTSWRLPLPGNRTKSSIKRPSRESRSKRAVARSKCQLARELHKNLPRPAPKCAVSAHPARCGAQPARIARFTLHNKDTCLYSLAVKSLRPQLIAKSAIWSQAAGRRSGDSPSAQVAGGEAVRAIGPHLSPSARATPKFHSIGFHLWSKYRAEGRGPTSSPKPVRHSLT
jgi:hypothetical protein